MLIWAYLGSLWRAFLYSDDVAGVTLAVTAGVTRAALGCDLLVSRFDILKLEEHGFRLSAKA